MIVDLHTHSTASDGALAPAALLELARDEGVDVIAITDHDTLDAYAAIAATAPSGLQLVTGVELSTTWCGRGIHIVGLNVDPANPELGAGILQQQRARRDRARIIADRLARIGITDVLPAVEAIAGDSPVGRPHFAAHLVAAGHAKDRRHAFQKFLGPGKTGDVRDGWAALDEVIRWIVAAGGHAVLAHPGKYRMTTAKLRALLDDFVAAGGGAIEVVCGPQDPSLTARLAGIAADFGLAASTGSDFHDPANAWSRPGRFSPLPGGLKPVLDLW